MAKIFLSIVVDIEKDKFQGKITTDGKYTPSHLDYIALAKATVEECASKMENDTAKDVFRFTIEKAMEVFENELHDTVSENREAENGA